MPEEVPSAAQTCHFFQQRFDPEGSYFGLGTTSPTMSEEVPSAAQTCHFFQQRFDPEGSYSGLVQQVLPCLKKVPRDRNVVGRNDMFVQSMAIGNQSEKNYQVVYEESHLLSTKNLVVY